MIGIRLRRLWWRVWNRFWFTVPGAGNHLDWPWRLRCDGYRQIGGHMAQYCLRLRGHKGLCLASIHRAGADDFPFGPAEFDPDREATPW